jgi:hypothetical protein
MVLHGRLCGRVERRRFIFLKGPNHDIVLWFGPFFVLNGKVQDPDLIW